MNYNAGLCLSFPWFSEATVVMYYMQLPEACNRLVVCLSVCLPVCLPVSAFGCLFTPVATTCSRHPPMSTTPDFTAMPVTSQGQTIGLST